MRVLDYESIKQYDYMNNSLAFVALGDLEQAVVSAYDHIEKDAKTGEEKFNIALYIAKLYSKMGETGASTNILFRLLARGKDEGRVYALLAYNFYREGDEFNGDLYHALMLDWNGKHDNILEIDNEYHRVLKDTKSKASRNDFVDLTWERKDAGIITTAWEYAFNGETDKAREVISSLDDSTANAYQKARLLTALDIADGVHSEDTDEQIENILNGDNILSMEVVSLVYVLEKAGNMQAIARLAERVIAERISTCRINFIHAVALHNIGEKARALTIMRRLARAYGTAYPYVRVAKYFMEKDSDIYLPIYDVENAKVLLLRDSEVCRLVLGKDIESWIGDHDIVGLVRDMYESGKVTDAIGYVTNYLKSSEKGIKLLQDILLDNEVQTAKMRLYIARNLLEVKPHVMAIYQNVFNECYYKEEEGMTEKEKSDLKDDLAYELVSGS